MVGQSPTEVLEMRPVVPVKTIADLGAHVREEKSLVHGILTPFRIGRRDLMPPIVSGAEVVVELSTEFLRDAFVLNEGRVGPVAIIGAKGGRRDMLSYPVWVSCSAIE